MFQNTKVAWLPSWADDIEQVLLRYNALVRESMQKLDFAAALHNNHGELAHADCTPDRSRVEVLVVKSGVPKIDHLIYL